MTAPEPNVCPVDPARLEYDRGDIAEAYSADRIGSGQPIRTPFEHGGNLWCCVSISGKGLTSSGEQEFQAYRLLPPAMFQGQPTTYSAKTAIEGGDFARGDPKGFYDGISVKCGAKTLILSGPPARFVAEPTPDRPAAQPEAQQMSLFS